jgi:hypothetical protein
VVVVFSWADESGLRHHWAHVLELIDGKIAGMQDYRSPSHAAAAMRLRAALG